MEIGGYDIVFNTECTPTAQEVFDAVKRVWPRVRFEDGDSRGERGSLHVSVPETKEFFLYRHVAAYRAINKVGVEDYLANDFLHFILEDRNGQATMVVGEPNEEVDQMIRLLVEECGWSRECQQAGAA